MVWNPLGGGGTHLDLALTQISVGFPNNMFTGSALLPSVPVRRISDKYYIFGREGWLPEDDYRAPGTEANEVGNMQVSADTYYTQEHALQAAIPDEERENVDSPFSPDSDVTNLLTSKLYMGRELAIKTLVTTAANYATGHSTTISNKWDDYVNSTPIADFKAGKRVIHSKLFTEPTLSLFPWLVMSYLEDHPDLIERIKYSQVGLVTSQLIASVVGISQILVPGMGIATGNPGQTLSVGYLWGDDVVMAYVPSSPGMRIPAFGYEFTQPLAGNANGVERWREDRRVSDVIRTRRRYDLKLVALDSSNKSIAGYVMKDVLSV